MKLKIYSELMVQLKVLDYQRKLMVKIEVLPLLNMLKKLNWMICNQLIDFFSLFDVFSYQYSSIIHTVQNDLYHFYS